MILFALTIVGLMLHRLVLTPLKQISRSVQSVESGNYDVEVPISGPAEIAQLSLHFKDMIAVIRKHRDDLQNIVAERTKRLSLELEERKRTELDLQVSHERMALLLNSMTEGAYGVDTEGNCTFVNPSCLRMLGYVQADDLIGRNIHTLIHHTYPDGKPYPAQECGVRLSTKKGQQTHVDNEVHWRADGTSFPVEYWSNPIYQEGKIVGAMVTFVDITERKRAEEQLLLTQSASDHAPYQILWSDAKARIRYANVAACHEHGYTNTELMGMTICDLDPDFPIEAWPDHWEALKKLKTISLETRHRRKDGSIFPVAVSANLVKFGGIEYNIGYSIDITDRKLSEDKSKPLTRILNGA